MLKLVKKEKLNLNPRKLFNIQLRPSGWKGPFNTYEDFINVAEKLTTPYAGDFTLLDNGVLRRGFTRGLHTFIIPSINHEGDHIHFNGFPYYCRIVGEETHITDKTYQMGKGFPIFTLQGLYTSLPDESEETKKQVLIREINKHNVNPIVNPDFDVSRTRLSRKLAFLEWQYRLTVSDQ